ncbi:hypothetical protein [Campylobacter armoricus]|nr:hypothetical protein [Campylobacter armoricus]
MKLKIWHKTEFQTQSNDILKDGDILNKLYEKLAQIIKNNFKRLTNHKARQ